MIVHFSRNWILLLSLATLGSVAPARAACLDPGSSLYSRARALYGAGQYLLSATHFSQVAGTACDADLRDRSLYAYALALAELGEVSEALRTLETLSLPQAPVLRSFLTGDRSPLLLESVRLRFKIWDERLESSLMEPLRIDGMSSQKFDEVKSLRTRLGLVPAKSEWLAGGLSTVLPGAGQAYTRNFQSAALSFVLNAVFLATTLEFARKDMPAAAVASGMVFSVTYLGNILNAVDSVKRFNQLQRDPYEKQLRPILFPELVP
ncbi:MAG TPA: hypothetical protein DCS07_14070 [Bdellovibrionales bacterium]|nr:MAG: hypothetical protein A2070_13895 [Bdellovibrionales bacterium GWC1_52_8]HAR43737.1 hypothetical protein [Bdellovibrionales bacterium]